MKFTVLKNKGKSVKALGVNEMTSQINKLSQQFHKINNPSNEELEKIYHEHDIYQLDRLAQELYGIRHLSLHIDRIKEMLKTKE